MTTPAQPPDLAHTVPPPPTSSLPTPSSSPLPPPFTHTHPPPLLLTQGAEAVLYKTHFLTSSHPCALKHRPSKPYRHPTLDARLTRHRILSEARTLVRCRRDGVSVPAVLGLEWEARGTSGGWMLMEWVEGETVRRVLDGWVSGAGAGAEGAEVVGLMERIGGAVGGMHRIGVVHGDLMTSNLMLRPRVGEGAASNGGGEGGERGSLEGEIVLIDFGLSAQSVQDEDKAVDLYVLERAFGSTHPKAEGLFREVLRAYGESYKGAGVVLKRLEEVRMRGRKRSMLG